MAPSVLKLIAAGPIRYIILLCIVIATIIWLNLGNPAGPQEMTRASTARYRCRGKSVYIYELPVKFNQDLIDNCAEVAEGERCKAYENGGFGRPLTHEDGTVFDGGSHWWATDAHSLEVIFHRRMQSHLCRVDEQDRADIFFVPFYPSLDFERSLSTGNTSKEAVDALALELAAWMSQQPAFIRYAGRDHFMVLGTPTWSFRRLDKLNDTWGSKLEYIEEFDNMMKLEVERHPWAPGHSVGIPYPTGFHPAQDDVLLAWQNKVQASERDLLWSYVAIGPANQEVVAETRQLLIQQCAEATSCKFLNCTAPNNPGCGKGEIMEMYLRSRFSVQPKADTFTSQAIFESMLGGAVPVFLWKESAYPQYLWHLPDKPEAYSVYIPFDDLPRWTKVEEQLGKISADRVVKMQDTVAKLMPKLVYLDPEHWSSDVKDAADVALDFVSEDIREAKKNVKPQYEGPLEKGSGADKEEQEGKDANDNVSTDGREGEGAGGQVDEPKQREVSETSGAEDGDKSKQEGGEDGDKSKQEGGEDGDKSKQEGGEDGDKSKQEGGEDGDKSKQEVGEDGDKSKQEGGEDGDKSKQEGGEDGDKSKQEGGEDGDKSKEEGARAGDVFPGQPEN